MGCTMGRGSRRTPRRGSGRRLYTRHDPDEEWHPSQRVEELPDGRARLLFHVGVTPELRRWVLGFGRQVRVVRPEGLGEWVREEARAVGELGECPAPPPGEQPSPACTRSVGEPLAERGKRGCAG